MIIIDACIIHVCGSQDPDYCVEIETDHPEFRKLAFTSPGPKNAFAPLQRSSYGRQPHLPQPQSQPGGTDVKREEADTVATVTATMSEGRLASLSRERL